MKSKARKSRRTKRKAPDIVLPPAQDWRTTDEDELNRRRLRARTEVFKIENLDPKYAVFSNFRVTSGSGRSYEVEIRNVRERQFGCACPDFRTSGLSACKHVEAVLLQLEGRLGKRRFAEAVEAGPDRADLGPDRTRDTLQLTGPQSLLPAWVCGAFDAEGGLREVSPEDFVARVRRLQPKGLRVSLEVESWLEARCHAAERVELRREYERKVQSGEWPAHETRVPLYPYQREGMLHLAFTGRALLADEMGLGKTIQAIAACALLHRLGQARRVLIVAPASLKSEWEDQIQKFTPLNYQIVYGRRPERLKCYGEDAPFFTIVNYEQMMPDALDVNERLRPDVVVLDEAQRIKNWSTKTAQAIKRLQSRYAFVLTGTPIENRIDELHSLMDFLDPAVLGPLFRFNRDFYELDERGKPAGYRNLGALHERISPSLLRRRKAQVETELPARTDRNHFVPLSAAQRDTYGAHEAQVSRLMHAAQRRPLTPREQDKLMRELAMMRMICDTNFILDPEERTCPKLAELENVLEEMRDNPEVKAIVFSEWEKMLILVRELCDRLGIGWAWHTGSVPQQRRRGEINRFKSDPDCRVFLSTDAGATGLNLQNASIVINCDLPWNPAKLEQRIARAWRKHQTRPVSVINLVSEDTIEHRMLATLADKAALAGGVLDREGDVDEIKLRSGRQAMLQRLEQIMSASPTKPVPPAERVLPADRSAGFASEVAGLLDGALLRCEERYPLEGEHTVLCVVVEGNAADWRTRLEPLHDVYFGKSDPLAPVTLEVIDRATQEAIDRLVAAGLLARTTRGSRPLSPETAAVSLSAEEQAALAVCRDTLARKLKIARVLGEAGLAEEARPPLLEAILERARAVAIEHRLPGPESVEAALMPPLARHFGERLTLLREFVNGAGQDRAAVLSALDS